MQDPTHEAPRSTAPAASPSTSPAPSPTDPPTDPSPGPSIPAPAEPGQTPDQAPDEARIRRLVDRYGDGQDGSAPTAEQWRRLLARPADAPVTLVNLFALREAARYEAPAEGLETGGSGRAAMMRYAAVSGPALERAGGRFLLVGPAEASVMGPEESWDMVAVGQYPSLASLLALFDDDAYRAAYAHRVAAVARQRVVAVTG